MLDKIILIEQALIKEEKIKEKWQLYYFIYLVDDDYDKYYKEYCLFGKIPYEKWTAELDQEGFIQREYSNNGRHFNYILKLKGVEWLKNNLGNQC